MAPKLLDCAHTDALTAAPPLRCPVCAKETSVGAVNHGMAEAAEAEWAQGDTVTSSAVLSPPASLCGLCLEDGIEEAATHLCETCDVKFLCSGHAVIHKKRKAPHCVIVLVPCFL